MRQLANGKVLLAVAALALAACIPLFTDGFFQTLRLAFAVDETLAEGEERLVHTVIFAEDVKVRKSYVQISGRLTPAEGEEPPEQVTVTGEIEDPRRGKLVQRVTLRLAVDEEGLFEASSRLRKDVSAGDVLTVTVAPSGGDLGRGAELVLCLDLVKKKGDLALLPDCLEEEMEEPPPGDANATFSSLANDYFGPTCSQAGCHSVGTARAELVLVPAMAYGNLVNVPSSQQPQFNRVTPGDPDNSYLVRKLRGNGIQGDRMPQGGPFLSPDEIDRFVRWIDNGAPDD